MPSGLFDYNLKPFEKYKLEDIPHYFIKFYGRWRVPRTSNNDALSENDEIVVRMEDSDVSERMNLIKDTIENFIYMYDKVSENIEGSDAKVLTISDDEIRAYASSLRREFAKSRDKGKR